MKNSKLKIQNFLFSAAFLAGMLVPCVYAAAADDDNITDVQEQKNYVQGAYTEGAEGNTLAVKKGEGFDFKIPEIVITGQIDTKVLLNRETTSLDDLQEVKNVLYEKERISMPYSYLGEEALAPQNEDMAAARDFMGKLLLSAGTYSDITVDGIIGKAFDDINSAVLRLGHNNFENTINDRLVAWNTNNGEVFYDTTYGDFEAIYVLKGEFNRYENPYPSNMFGSSYDMQNYEAGVSASGAINTFGVDAAVKYVYFDEKNNAGGFLYREDRLAIKANIEKDFAAEQEKKIKTMLSVDGWYSEVNMDGKSYTGVFNLNMLFMGIFYFEPVVFKGGIRLQDYNLDINYYRMSPYLSVAYDALPALSFYADFNPIMQVVDNTEFLKTPFTAAAASAGFEMPMETADLQAGARANVFDTAIDLFYGYKSIINNIYLDASASTADAHGFAFSYSNDDLDYSFAGISVETLKLKNIKVKFDYRYVNILKQSAATTYLPYNSLGAKVIYQPAEWEFTLAGTIKSAQRGATGGAVPAYADLDFSASRKITDNFTLRGYVNNVLNNNYYLLYYYNEKGINLGLTAVLKF